ncbi:hypothetical protein JRI60_45285 [Archangium violaceum]|nr:hypothetical protein [Archangium violaceum]QRN96165.1 hypothetical protein JRI60_45285 [Archangium violaceum]
MALRLSPRYMPAGIREAAEELFKDPAFLAGIATALVVYIVAWAAPEPIFTKSFAISVTAVLTFAFTLAELTHLGLVALRLYQDTEGSRTLGEIEAAAKRFGRSLGGVGLRAMVFVASYGVGKAFPRLPPGGLRALLAPPRYAVAGGLELTAATSVQAVADGTLLISGVAAGATSSTLRSACKDGSRQLAGH